MTATLDGNRRIAAGRLGLELDEYQGHLDAGEVWCIGCRRFHPADRFHRDATRLNGLSRRCRDARQERRITPPDPIKVRARNRVQTEVRAGRLPHPNTVPCVDCGHVFGEGDDPARRHEYDHHNGYDDDHVLDVVVVCTVDHGRRESERRKPELLAAVVGAYLEAKAR